MIHLQSNPQDHVLRDAIMLWPVTGATDAPVYDAAWFEAVFMAVDRLHDLLSSDSPNTVSRLAPEEMAGWLEDIVYTAQEAIFELRTKYPGENVTAARC